MLAICLLLVGCNGADQSRVAPDPVGSAASEPLADPGSVAERWGPHSGQPDQAAAAMAAPSDWSQADQPLSAPSAEGPAGEADWVEEARPAPSQFRSLARAAPGAVVEEPSPQLQAIDVLFATDRLPIHQLLPSPLRLWAPVAAVLAIGGAFLVGWLVRPRWAVLWLGGGIASSMIALMGSHSAVIRYQQAQRLSTDAVTAFTGLRDDTAPKAYPLHLGVGHVTLPPGHQVGRLERPSIWRLEFIESPDKHIVLHQLQLDASPEAWFGRIDQAVARSGDAEAFLFVHGFNVNFADALKRTAQLSADLGVTGPTICYSWPSRGKLAAYSADEATVSWTAPHLEELIEDIRQRTQVQAINIVAHSMGSRATLEALERLYLRQSDRRRESRGLARGEPAIKNVILAAPDVDAVQFQSRYLRPLQQVSQRTTIYFSSVDRALQASAGIHWATRLGVSAHSLSTLEGLDVIHIGLHDLFGIGHSYYGNDPAVVADMAYLLRHGADASARPLLYPVSGSANDYWELDRGRLASLGSQAVAR